MASLSVSTRHGGLLFGAPKLDDKAGSVTYPGMLRRWFAAAGSSMRADTMGFGFQTSTLRQTLQLMQHWAGNWLVLQIDASLVGEGGIGFYTNRHWVVVSPHHRPTVRLGPAGPVVPMGSAVDRFDADQNKRFGSFGAEIDKTPDPMDWETSLHIVSWGVENMPPRSAKLKYLQRRIYGGYAFSRIR